MWRDGFVTKFVPTDRNLKVQHVFLLCSSMSSMTYIIALTLVSMHTVC